MNTPPGLVQDGRIKGSKVFPMGSQELACQEFVELVTGYLEGTLPPAERVRFEQHLAVCDGCTTFLEQMRQTVRLLGRLTEEAIPVEGKEKLLTAFHNWKRIMS
jgi:anti-sigma factor RsiW